MAEKSWQTYRTFIVQFVLYLAEYEPSILADRRFGRETYFSTPLYATHFDIPFREMVECHTWSPGDVMKATGILPHVSLLLSMSELMKCMNDMPDQIKQWLNQGLQMHEHFLRCASADKVKAVMVEASQEVIGRKEADESERSAAAVVPIKYPPLFLSNENKLTRIPPNFKLPRGPLHTAWARYFC